MAAAGDITVKDEVLDDALAALGSCARRPASTRGACSSRATASGRSSRRGSRVLDGAVAGGRAARRSVAAHVRGRPGPGAVARGPRRERRADGSRRPSSGRKRTRWPTSTRAVRTRSAAPILGASRAYWLDLRDQQPVDAARSLDRPILVLQGERDYQVTMNDFAGWKQALAGRKDVTFKSYPKLNHFFVAGEGRSAPEEYKKPGHVAAQSSTTSRRSCTGARRRSASAARRRRRRRTSGSAPRRRRRRGRA